ncbi:MAG TPA: Uma2 family endonuclease [Vicinamibacterales bacterium]|nr:Uma2 family endonuclease [Vicinamibacterales bacterium]
MPVAVSRKRFSADDYQRMGQAGILRREDRVELIDGEIIAMTPIGPRHCASVARATRAFVTKAGDSAIVRVQGSVRLDFYSEPEPDLVLVRPRADFYASAHPGPADIVLIVEVAQSSIDYDREFKSLVYARAGVHEYWLADLNENVLTCYSSPEGGTYQRVERYTRGQSLAPQLLPDCVVSTEDLLSE